MKIFACFSEICLGRVSFRESNYNLTKDNLWIDSRFEETKGYRVPASISGYRVIAAKIATKIAARHGSPDPEDEKGEAGSPGGAFASKRLFHDDVISRRGFFSPVGYLPKPVTT